MTRFQVAYGPLRGAVYFDGYNLYHRINDLRRNHYKWLNLWRLSELICARHGVSVRKATFCTAVPDEPDDVRQRHLTYINAQKAVGVQAVLGHHVIERETGKRTEKQSDLNLALSLMRDAYCNEYDCAYLVSGDSDQAATAKFFRQAFPNKFLVGVAPPTLRPPEKLTPFADDVFALEWEDIERSVFRGDVIGRSGKPIPRPVAYDPPRRWTHPDERD